jgi:hypothetical protein
LHLLSPPITHPFFYLIPSYSPRHENIPSSTTFSLRSSLLQICDYNYLSTFTVHFSSTDMGATQAKKAEAKVNDVTGPNGKIDKDRIQAEARKAQHLREGGKPPGENLKGKKEDLSFLDAAITKKK